MSRTKAHKFEIKYLGTIEIYKNYIKIIKRFELERTSCISACFYLHDTIRCLYKSSGMLFKIKSRTTLKHLRAPGKW